MQKIINVAEIIGARQQGKTYQLKRMFMKHLLENKYRTQVFVGSGEINREFTEELKNNKVKRSYWFVNPMTLKVYQVVDNRVISVNTIENFLVYSVSGEFTFYVDNFVLKHNKVFVEQIGKFNFDDFYLSTSKVNQGEGRKLLSKIICDDKKKTQPKVDYRYRVATVKTYPDQPTEAFDRCIEKRFAEEFY